MTDRDIVRKKLAEIETYLRELRQLARPELIEEDLREARFVEHTLQVAIQAALDVASHIVADDRLGEPGSYRELFAILARHGWLEPALASRLEQMAGFRNILVHGYGQVNRGIVREVAEQHLGDFDAFVSRIREQLLSAP